MSIVFLLDKNPTIVPLGLAGERLKGARKVSGVVLALNSSQIALLPGAIYFDWQY